MCASKQQFRRGSVATPKQGLNKPSTKREVVRAVILILTLTAVSSQGYSAVSCSQNPSVSSDLTYFDAAVQNGELMALAYARQPFELQVPGTSRQVDFFIDADQNRNTGDGRPGAVRGADYRMSCTVILDSPSCALYQLPTKPDGPEIKVNVPVQATLPSLYGGHGLLVSVAKNFRAVDIFALAHGGIPFGGGTGNGDRCPEAGVFDTATRSAIVRQPAPLVDATVSSPTGSELAAWRFQTKGDQFHIEVTYKHAIDVFDMWFSGRLELDTDRSLQSGLVQTPFMVNSPFNEIPSWGWDVAIQFRGGSESGDDPTPFYLDFGRQSGFISPPRSYAYPSGFAFGESYNDGRWWISPANRLVLEGSLSMLDARSWQAHNGTINAVRQPTQGQVIGRLFTNRYAQISDMIPKNGWAFDTARKLIVPPIAWNQAQMISKTLPVGNTPIAQWDLTKVDAEISNGNLIVRGTLARLDPSWFQWGAFLLLDTDANSSTGTPVGTIGADYRVRIDTDDLGGYFGRTAYLVKPDGSWEGHDSWINFKYSDSNQVNSPASFITTIPLAAVGNPKAKIRLYVATYFLDGYLQPQIADIGPWPQPLDIGP